MSEKPHACAGCNTDKHLKEVNAGFRRLDIIWYCGLCKLEVNYNERAEVEEDLFDDLFGDLLEDWFLCLTKPC